jgi:hypothetical protein
MIPTAAAHGQSVPPDCLHNCPETRNASRANGSQIV